MAVWKGTVSGYQVVINDIDHLPPHCHVFLGRRNVQVNLWTLEIRDPPPHRLPGNVRRRLAKLQEELLEAWDSVKIVPPGSDTVSW